MPPGRRRDLHGSHEDFRANVVCHAKGYRDTCNFCEWSTTQRDTHDFRPGGKPRKAKRTFTPLRPLYKVENTFAQLGMWRRLSRCFEQTALGAQTWLEVACVAYLCGRLRIEPT